jgi:hypothetical protein
MGILGRNNAPMAQVVGYGISAVVISYATVKFMDNRGVTLRDVWVWGQADRKPMPKDGFAPTIYGMSRSFDEMMAEPESVPWWRSFGELDGKFLVTLLIAASLGIALGLVGLGYTALLEHLPWTAELMRKAQEARQNLPGWRLYTMVMAVGFAPFAEEYLFRGLLFRALDREWGGWKAVVGSAAFFAIYHPPLAWPLVFCVGAINAVLFKRMRRLAPAVVLHLLHNAVVLSR